MKQIGLRAHDLGTFNTIEELAVEVGRYGSSVPIQLALKKVLKQAPNADAYTQDFIVSIREALAAHGSYVGVFGCYINPVHPDKAVRDEHLRRFENHLKYAKLLGCPLVGNRNRIADTRLLLQPRYRRSQGA
jgi:sugar phosphate isomerase/epimerase